MSDTLNGIQVPWVATYATLTAEAILAYANVHLSRDQLEIQLTAHDTFYAGLVRLPALITFNSLINSQCRDIQTYSQERLIEYILSGMDQKMTSPTEMALKETIEETRLKLISLGEALTTVEKAHYELMLNMYSLQEKQAFEWTKTAETQVNSLWTAVERCQPTILPYWKIRFADLVKTQAAGVIIPEKFLQKLKIKEPVPLLKALLQLFIEESGDSSGGKSGSELPKRKPCAQLFEAVIVANDVMQTLQKELENARESILLNIYETENAMKEMRTKLIDMREEIINVLSLVSTDELAFQPSADTLASNQEMDVTLSATRSQPQSG